MKTFLLNFIKFSFILTSLSGCFIPEPQYIKVTDTLNVSIQPIEALNIAAPYLEKHATYIWKQDKELKTHIVKHRKWYYIMRTNYPAKSVRYYMQPAVRVNTTTGKVTFIEK